MYLVFHFFSFVLLFFAGDLLSSVRWLKLRMLIRTRDHSRDCFCKSCKYLDRLDLPEWRPAPSSQNQVAPYPHR
jgi:hypothetical protein